MYKKNELLINLHLVADFTNHFLLCIAPFLDAFPVGKLWSKELRIIRNWNNTLVHADLYYIYIWWTDDGEVTWMVPLQAQGASILQMKSSSWQTRHSVFSFDRLLSPASLSSIFKIIMLSGPDDYTITHSRKTYKHDNKLSVSPENEKESSCHKMKLKFSCMQNKQFRTNSHKLSFMKF